MGVLQWLACRLEIGSIFGGPSIIDNASHLFIGAAVHSNNVVELLAIIFGLMWFSERYPADVYILEYDSHCAAFSV